MLQQIIEQERFLFATRFSSWEEAIIAGCQPLVLTNAVDASYAEQIIASIRKYGAYLVIAPFVALPHCQENAAGVRETAVSFLRVREPVVFDPLDRSKDAQIFFTLSARDPQAHLQNLSFLATLLEDQTMIDALRACESVFDLQKVAAQIARR